MSGSGWSYSFAPRATQDLDNLDEDDRRRIYATLDRFAADPVASGVNIQRISGSRVDWRLRVGRWRIIFQYDRPARMILVTRVLPRNEGTYRRR